MTEIYVQCLALGLLGMALQIILKLKSIQEKALSSKVEFNAGMYFKYDWLSLLGSVVSILFALFFLKDALEKYPNISVIKLMFGFIGYTGADIMSRIFSVVNKRLNNIIDLKTKPENVIDPVSQSLNEKSQPKT